MENYDRVVIGASIRYGHYHSAFQEFVKKHATRLNSMPSAFLFRKPGGAQTGEAYSTDQQLRAEVSDELAMASRSLRGHCRGAALPTLSLVRSFMIKLIMKMSGGETDTRKEVVYTDWEQVANFAREIAHLTDKPTLK
ncbi:protoporphyrinogen oxidase [Escherichia coli]|uniref:Protoporphyrinogen oxidase n=1 Tax=Escherichia coli TaxID=562 RepID=A0A2X3M8G7_ECOLX|nr:protoporphyrinogen oxidase [Escherichia coli]